ncbi:helix-turn-helix transcriptional regulator [Lactococcus lactis]|uniref:helix-turn-helix domain-containing protein n=1 Tax=Lactococcus lactis TaxID=1358 RepID=UPI0026589145|nr:helix-turn-helix transcriptional regulator [Lactococcus lactis]WKF73623.1 helix-turn-helix transcriptional regulator [Lactococcus lactis]
MTTFERIKDLADKQKISLQKVAIDNGLSENAIYGWKTRKPKGDDLAKVANYFHVPVGYLLGLEEKAEILDETEEQLIAAFRLESKDLDDDGKRRFNNSLQNLIKAARETIADSKKRKG